MINPKTASMLVQVIGTLRKKFPGITDETLVDFIEDLGITKGITKQEVKEIEDKCDERV